jgi:plastocyanin
MRLAPLAAVLLGVTTLGMIVQQRGATADEAQSEQTAPGAGYLESRRGVQNPFGILGGPIQVTVRQASGEAYVALPDYRRLDARIFGTPEFPRAYGGTPLISGVPLAMRDQEGGRYTQLRQVCPFGDKYVTLSNGKLRLEAVDATATDAAVTEDTVDFEATWQDDQGNTYGVRCTEVIPHGVEFPVFGGVVTNHILNGFSGIGSPLMPTGFAYVAFWGTGEVLKNGQVADSPVMVCGMLTEMVRTQDNRLATDEQVTPTRRQFHIFVPPFVPAKDNRSYVPRDVRTGYRPADDEELAFWHVIFTDLDIEADRHLTDGERRSTADCPQTQERETPVGLRTSDQEIVVGMTNTLRYMPSEITIRLGQTVVWKNTSDMPHTVTADPALAKDANSVRLPEGAKPFNSGNMPPGAAYRHTFQVPGTYRYFCIPHEAAGMIGTVHVQDKQ